MGPRQVGPRLQLEEPRHSDRQSQLGHCQIRYITGINVFDSSGSP